MQNCVASGYLDAPDKFWIIRIPKIYFCLKQGLVLSSGIASPVLPRFMRSVEPMDSLLVAVIASVALAKFDSGGSHCTLMLEPTNSFRVAWLYAPVFLETPPAPRAKP